MIESLFGSTRKKVMSLFFLNSDKHYYFSEVARATGTRQGAIQRELKSLVSTGVLNAEVRGRQTFYSVNAGNPIYKELRGIVYKTFGVAEILKSALKPMKQKIKIAYIDGLPSYDEETDHKDIDLTIIGKLKFSEFASAVGKAEELLGRTINPTILPIDEFREELKSDDHFLNSAIKTPHTFLVGDQDDIRKLIRK